MIAVEEDFGRLLAMLRLFGKTKSPFLPFKGQALAIAKMLAAPHTDSSTAYAKAVPAGRHHAKLLEVDGATIVDDGALVSAAVTSIVSKDADGVTLDAYDIPAAVQALTGYGWSAREAFCYIDFERKVFVQRVASVDLGNQSWVRYANAGHELFYTSLAGVKSPPTENDIGNILCPLYAADTMYLVYRHTTDMTMALQINGRLYVYDAGRMSMTAAQFKAEMSGVMLNYELATPIETDISAYLSDAVLDVAGGGTLTFSNQHEIPAPSLVVFTI